MVVESIVGVMCAGVSDASLLAITLARARARVFRGGEPRKHLAKVSKSTTRRCRDANPTKRFASYWHVLDSRCFAGGVSELLRVLCVVRACARARVSLLEEVNHRDDHPEQLLAENKLVNKKISERSSSGANIGPDLASNQRCIDVADACARMRRQAS